LTDFVGTTRRREDERFYSIVRRGSNLLVPCSLLPVEVARNQQLNKYDKFSSIKKESTTDPHENVERRNLDRYTTHHCLSQLNYSTTNCASI
jgi:hypothetical protein